MTNGESFEEQMTRAAYAYEGRYPKKDAPARRHGFAEGARWAEARAEAERTHRERLEVRVQGLPWTERVTFGEESALVVEWPTKVGAYWWVLCPASATLVTEVPSVWDDPTTPDDHVACSVSPECDFFELHALAHAAIRLRLRDTAAAALAAAPGDAPRCSVCGGEWQEDSTVAPDGGYCGACEDAGRSYGPPVTSPAPRAHEENTRG